MSAKGIIVLGAPRSGTTLLRRILDAHPSIACPPETTLFGACARFLHEQPLDHGVQFGVVEGLCQAGFDEDEVLGRLRGLAFGFLEDHAAAADKPRWAEKTAADVFHLAGIERLCGSGVQYICMVRHGLDAAVSLAELTEKSGGYLAEIHRYIQQEHRPLVAYTNAWIDATRGLLDLVERRPDDAVLLRYEDLVADPLAALEPVFAHLGEPFGPEQLATALGHSSAGFGDWKTWSRNAIDASSVGRYRKAVSKHLRAELAPRINPVLERAGYAPIKAPKIAKIDAKKRMNLAMRMNALKGSGPVGG